jgi:hypothetical protein
MSFYPNKCWTLTAPHDAANGLETYTLLHIGWKNGTMVMQRVVLSFRKVEKQSLPYFGQSARYQRRGTERGATILRHMQYTSPSATEGHAFCTYPQSCTGSKLYNWPTKGWMATSLAIGCTDRSFPLLIESSVILQPFHGCRSEIVQRHTGVCWYVGWRWDCPPL